jgi:hypothetical protein
MYEETENKIMEAVKKNGGYRVSIREIENEPDIKKAKESFLKDLVKNQKKYGLTDHRDWIKINIDRLIEKKKIKKDELGLIILTEAGWMKFEPIYKRFWHGFKGDIRTIIIAVIISIITTITTLFIYSLT